MYLAKTRDTAQIVDDVVNVCGREPGLLCHPLRHVLVLHDERNRQIHLEIRSAKEQKQAMRGAAAGAERQDEHVRVDHDLPDHHSIISVSYTHLRAHETVLDLV